MDHDIICHQIIDIIKNGNKDLIPVKDWVMLLWKYPQYGEVCDKWHLIPRGWIREILIRHPVLQQYCDLSNLTLWDWTTIIEKQPLFADHPMYKLKML